MAECKYGQITVSDEFKNDYQITARVVHNDNLLDNQ